jgi:hypothetical protein
MRGRGLIIVRFFDYRGGTAPSGTRLQANRDVRVGIFRRLRLTLEKALQCVEEFAEARRRLVPVCHLLIVHLFWGPGIGGRAQPVRAPNMLSARSIPK